ncbi:MAG: DUF429 domain-containing protein [Anaerolineae bacterium]
MLSSAIVYAGVDPTAAHKAFTYALLDRELNVLALDEGELEDVVDVLAGKDAVTVAINAPAQLNRGLLRQSRQEAGPAGHQLRGVDMRLGELELRQHGIPVSGTAGRESSCAGWVRAGLALYRGLTGRGFEPYPADACPHRVLETHPHAAFCALLERTPLSKPSTEGRLQRQLVLFDRGVGLRDPLEYFEEITRHKLLHGMLPVELLYTPEQLDALVAAYTAWVATEQPRDLGSVGTSEEGLIYLPVKELKDKY